MEESQSQVSSSLRVEESQSQVLSNLRLENQLLRSEVASLNQEMASVIQRAKDSQEGKAILLLFQTSLESESVDSHIFHIICCCFLLSIDLCYCA